jgi:heat shock protein HslJ
MPIVKELHKYFLGCANSSLTSSVLCSKSVKMKLITFISAGAFILFAAFVMKEKNFSQQTSLYDTKWSLKKIHTDAGVEEVNTKAIIKFNQEKKSAGGNGSCNTFGSNFIVNNNEISFKNIFATKMYCEGVQETEDAFLGQLEKVNRFEVKGNKLMLFENEKKLLEFTNE